MFFVNFVVSIDLIIIKEADNLWDKFGSNIWESYNPKEMSILLFESSQHQWLVNHPNPPFEYINTDILNNSISIGSENTKPLWHYFSATIWSYNNQWTTILPTLSAWKSFCKQRNIPTSVFPPDQLAIISLHERFHAYQIKWLEENYKSINYYISINI